MNTYVTDEAVNAATGVYGGPTARMRRALEAAIPLLGPRPLLDREALTEEIFRATAMQVSRNSSRDAADVALRMARPMPTQDQLAEALRKVRGRDGHYAEHGRHAYDGTCPVCSGHPEKIAAAVLALLSGGET